MSKCHSLLERQLCALRNFHTTLQLRGSPDRTLQKCSEEAKKLHFYRKLSPAERHEIRTAGLCWTGRLDFLECVVPISLL